MNYVFSMKSIEIVNTAEDVGGIHLLAQTDNEAVGVVVVSMGKIASIERISVYPQYQNQGIGTQLMAKAESLAAKQGARSIVRIGMFCESDSIPAWYKSVDFFKHRG